MQAPFEMTVGREKLSKILESFPPDSNHWNEAQNRFQFVDRLLLECLGWEHPYIEVENSDEGGGRADYVMGKPAKAVLEAKRESKVWQALPSGKTTSVRKIEPFLAASPAFKEVVTQVIPYCALRGATIAVVCNGPQLAIFQAMTPGQEPLKGECFLFDGFQSYLQHFPLLWTLLSPEGITENRALRDLALHRNARIPAKASTTIPEPTKYRYRDHLQSELREIGTLLLEEIEDNPDLRKEFYRECYVPIEANNRHLLQSKQIIDSRYRRAVDNNVNPVSLDSASKSGTLGDSYLRDAGSRPIVVLGDVGVGKTSFFENLFLHIGDTSKSYIININLGIRANLSDDLKNYILNAIPESLRENYSVDIDEASFVKTIYNDELIRFDRSIDGETRHSNSDEYKRLRREFLKTKTSKRDSHLQAAISYLARGQKRRIILVIDNADQRSFETQQEAFLIAQELASSRSMHVFIALRPSTFYISKTSGTLAAYQNKILTISPPPADEVIQRRLTFALRIAEGKAAPAALENIRLNLTSIVLFLRATLRSVKHNANIRQFLSNITGGNTRGVIELITSFCGSPNVDAKKIVDIEEAEGDYRVPIHEFTKHALLGEYSYYNPQSSLVACNVFDTSMADYREHFLGPILVSYISSNLGTRDNDGFVSGDVILTEMARLGFLEEQVFFCLRRFSARRLIETPHSHYKEIAVADDETPNKFYYRATSIGIYHARFWLGSFSFLDATSIDTPIFDNIIRTEVSKLAPSFDISDRYKKAAAFRDYLESKWHLSNFDINYFDFPSVVSQHVLEFEQVRKAPSGKSTSRRKKSGFGPYRS